MSNMFNALTGNVSKASTKVARKSGVEIPRTVSFLRALVDGKLRLSYAALALAAELLGEHTATNMSAGQRGAALLSGIPGTLQPHVCNAKGGYRKDISWDEAPDASVKTLRGLGFVRPENTQEFVQAFIKATDESNTSDDPDTSDES